VEINVKEENLTAEDQLFIVMQSAQYLASTRGLATPDLRIYYERAEYLSRTLNRPLVLHVALMGQWRYSLNTDKLTTTMQIAERLCSLAQQQNDSALRARPAVIAQC
jgi:hypothetical protein